MSLDSKERVYIHVIYLKLQVHWGKGIVSCSVSSVLSALFNVEMQFIYHLTLEKGLLRSIFTFWSFDIKRVYFVPRASRDAPISSTSSSSKSKFIVKYTRKAHANISRRIRLLSAKHQHRQFIYGHFTWTSRSAWMRSGGQVSHGRTWDEIKARDKNLLLLRLIGRITTI